MKAIGTVFLLLFSMPVAVAVARAEECGRYQIDDFGDRIVYSLVDYQHNPQGLIYNIENFNSPVVKSMIRDLCYCVEGRITQDPQDSGASSFMKLNIEIVHGPFGTCGAR